MPTKKKINAVKTTTTTTKTTNSSPPRRITSKKTKSVRSAPQMGRLAPQTQNWLRSVEDPFDSSIITPYIPSYPARRTLKTRVFAKGTLATSSTTGIGYLTAALQAAHGSDNSVGVYTTAANVIVATGSVPTTAAGTGIVTFSSNSPFTQSNFGTDLQYRLVSLGIRIKYTGSELNRGGSIVAFEHPLHQPINGYTLAQMLAFDQAVKLSVKDDSWMEVKYHFLDNNDFQFDYQAVSNPVLALAITAPSATTSIPFDWEMVANYEIVGTKARGASPTFSDIVGLEMVLNAMQLESNSASVVSVENDSLYHELRSRGVMERILEYGSATVSAVPWDRVGQIGSSVLTAYLRSRGRQLPLLT